MGKLTLSLEQEIIDRAKGVAKNRKTSLSKLVSQFLSSLEPAASQDAFLARLHQELEREGYKPSSLDDDKLRDRHIREKHR